MHSHSSLLHIVVLICCAGVVAANATHDTATVPAGQTANMMPSAVRPVPPWKASSASLPPPSHSPELTEPAEPAEPADAGAADDAAAGSAARRLQPRPPSRPPPFPVVVDGYVLPRPPPPPQPRQPRDPREIDWAEELAEAGIWKT